MACSDCKRLRRLEEIESLELGPLKFGIIRGSNCIEFKANQFPYPRLHDVAAFCEEKKITFLFCPTTSIGEHVSVTKPMISLCSAGFRAC